MTSGTGFIAPLVQSFFTDHLVHQRRASPQTVASYRDTFRLLLQHLSSWTTTLTKHVGNRTRLSIFSSSTGRSSSGET
jgi:site-specific recombinase XerD